MSIFFRRHVRGSKLRMFFWHLAAFWLLVNFVVIPHEMGHLLAALLFGAGVDAFSVGFGPELFSAHLWGIDWRMGAIPLGGYVAFAQSVETGSGTLLLGSLPQWQQLSIFFAGVGMNVLYALFIAVWLRPAERTDVTFPLDNKGFCCVPFAVNAGWAVVHGPWAFLWYTGCVSLELAIFNLLPIVPLDGGRIADLLVYQHLLALGWSPELLFIGSIFLSLFVLVPLFVRLARPVAHLLDYRR